VFQKEANLNIEEAVQKGRPQFFKWINEGNKD